MPAFICLNKYGYYVPLVMADGSRGDLDLELVVVLLQVHRGDDVVHVEGQLHAPRGHHQRGAAHHPLGPEERLHFYFSWIANDY